MGTGVHSQVKCEWQSEEKDEIIPDFFVVRANGYADIVEFKLPKVKRNTVVERNNREQFSAEINSYIAQTRVYPLYQTLRALLTHTDLLFIFHTLLEYKRTLY